jgi:hypothetical protein
MATTPLHRALLLQFNIAIQPRLWPNFLFFQSLLSVTLTYSRSFSIPTPVNNIAAHLLHSLVPCVSPPHHPIPFRPPSEAAHSFVYSP